MSTRLGSTRLGIAIAAAAFAFGLTLSVTAGAGSIAGTAADTRAEGAAHSLAVMTPPRHDDSAAMIAGLFREAPIGHRQPRAIDVPENPQLSPADLEQRRLDEEINRKLVICRGC
jgi:hypothetical protein